MLTINVTGKDCTQIIAAMVNEKVNTVYNTLYDILFQCKQSTLSDDVLADIGRKENVELSLETKGTTSWEVVLNTLGTLSINNALPLYLKIADAYKKATSGE